MTHTPDVLTEDVADMGLLLLATVRRLLPAERWVRQGHWQTRGMMPLNRSVTGKKLGTEETRGAMAQLVVDNLAAHFAGRPLLTPVG